MIIVRESFCLFYYQKSLRDINNFGLIPLFIFLKGFLLQLKFLHCWLTLNVCRRSGAVDYFIVAKQFGGYHLALLWLGYKYEGICMNRCSERSSWVSIINTSHWAMEISRNMLDHRLVKVGQVVNDANPLVLYLINFSMGNTHLGAILHESGCLSGRQYHRGCILVIFLLLL